MYRNKKDVDKHVDSLLSKLSAKEFKSRAYSIARLYYDIGDYSSCQNYVEQYLTFKDNNAAAHKLLGLALQKLGQKERALRHFTTSLELDPSQTSIIPDICELLADPTVEIDVTRAKYWCDKAQNTFPRHPATFRLRERLVSSSDKNPAAVAQLLTSELSMRPKDAILHSRLIKHYLTTNQTKQAFDHCCNVEFSDSPFQNNYAWYETLSEILKQSPHNSNDWLHQLLLLTVRERICNLSLTESPNVSSKSLVESNDLLHAFDQAIEVVAKAGPPPGFAEFHANVILHHKGQLAFLAATYLLKKAKKDQMSWKDAAKYAAPLFLIALQTKPIDVKVNWLSHAPEKQKVAAHRWYLEGTYRCSQSGHYLITNTKESNQSLLDKISQCCSGPHWRDTLYKRIFTSKEQIAKIASSFLATMAFNSPVLRLPRNSEIEAYDIDAQREYPNSLHHFVWILQNYTNYANFKCVLFDMLKPASAHCGPESLNKLDVEAFLFCAAVCSRQNRQVESYAVIDKPQILPANITDLLCSVPQMKWWDITYKYVQNELGSELTDVRTTLSRGIEVIRCMDNHGLDPELLCILGRTFSEKAKSSISADERKSLEMRAGLYYNAAVPYLEKLKNKVYFKIPEKRLFEYTHKDLSSKELNNLLDEAILYVAIINFNNSQFEKVIELIGHIKTPQAYYYLGQSYKNLSLEELNLSVFDKSKHKTLLTKAKTNAYRALNLLKEEEEDSQMISDVQDLIESIETHMSKIDGDLSINNMQETDSKNSSDENFFSGESVPLRNNHTIFRNLSSTPKQYSNSNMTKFRTPADSQILEGNQIDNLCLERIESQIKNLQQRDSTIIDFMEQSRTWFAENCKLGTQIISTINSNMQHTTDQFKLLKISVDQIKDQLDECKSECKDVSDLKKQIAELKKEVNKLKKTSSEQTIDDSDLYNLDDEYRSTENNINLPFNPPQMIPPFNQRLLPTFPVPPNPYQLYSQNMYNLYNQYSQFVQPQVPGAPTVFDPTRNPVNYPGMYPNPDQMYLDIAHLVPPTVQPPTSIPVIPTVPPVPNLPVVTTPAISKPAPAPIVQVTKSISSLESKEVPRSLPFNVVITSSDPLPSCIMTTPAPILSVTIPPKHIKGTPHNYQIQLPSTSETKGISSPIFSFPASGNKNLSTTGSSTVNWNPANLFKMGNSESTPNNTLNACKTENMFDRSVVDGTTSQNNSLNKSRTVSDTSVENYDPCPDFKPIVPLPDEIKVTTGEEDEIIIFSSRAKLFRFTNKEWKERGIGEMKLLKHKVTGKVRVLMRREQVHKICANHIITPVMEMKPMPNETKAYMWVANDFADETVVLENFCVRFKTADIAHQFYEVFERSRKQSSSNEEPYSQTKPDKVATSNIATTSATAVSQSNKSAFGGFKINTTQQQKPENKENSTPSNLLTQDTKVNSNKAVVGGFTFSSTPVFKPVTETKSESTPKPETETSNKLNIFSGLSLKTTSNNNTTSPFNNILFSNTPKTDSTNQTSAQIETKKTAEKLNSSDTIEEYEPTAEFKPVIPLPALVDQKTGEEDEIVLFEHRAQLLRFDTATKEWKERGLGNMKLLAQKDNAQKIRLLMRREQIMKVCCNHVVTKEMDFQKMPNVEKAVTWCAKDFSEGELVTETFCLRFRNAQICDNFIRAVKTSQSQLKDECKAAKEEQNAATQSQTGFGDKFKPKPGSWQCETCYTNNLESFTNCACCEQPQSEDKQKESSKSGWGDKFKPKAGSWECNQCLVRNDANVEICNVCNSPKNPTKASMQASAVAANTPKFNFGIPSQASNDSATKNTTTTASAIAGWGDKFKPKEGSWECKQCLVRNEGSLDQCSACSSPQDPTALNSKNSVTTSEAKPQTFKFGIPTPSSHDNAPKTTQSSIFSGTGAYMFSFGIPKTDEDKVATVPFTGTIFASPMAPPKTESPINFSMPKVETLKTEENKPFLLSKPQESSSSPAFGVTNESKPFEFKFKPKTPPKSKSPGNASETPKNDDSDGNEYASEDEGHHLHFSPVVPLPDKIDVVTGEENENELYAHRAKLFIFTSGEWKERGIGVVKVLKHKDNAKVRVVMRREQVLKICLNHALTHEINYTPKDEKTWLFAANDFSEGELNLQQFCLRFKTKEIAQEFKNAVESAKGTSNVAKKEVESDSSSDDVVFVSEILASAEEKQKAKELMLPENFFTYKDKDPCQGCRGCSDEDNEKPVSALSAFNAKQVTAAGSTPAKTAVSIFSSQMSTPTSSDKTFMGDTSIYRTPLGSIGSNTKSATPLNTTVVCSTADSTDKENAESVKTSLFAPSKVQPLQYNDSPLSKSASSDTQNVSTKSSLLAPPKLSTLNTSSNSNTSVEEKQNVDPKTLFGAAQQKTVFGGSIFSNVKSDSPTLGDNNKEDKGEVKSIFGDQKPVNLFTTTTPGSLFGPGSLSNKPAGLSIFNTTPNPVFGGNPIQPQAGLFGAPKPNTIWTTTTIQSTEAKKEPKFDSNLSFAALSSAGPGFGQRKEDFQWEGAGQQLFGGKKRTDNSKNDSNAGDNSVEGAQDEEYDPHYEPIVPLPDKIVVTTGEEDEQRVFCERCKLFRYDEKQREWKERGVGDMKILHHPGRNTYRLLLRREQVHKAVLNMLLTMDLELLPMKNSDRAWTWAGMNYAENAAGEQETLAVRFKSLALATSFHDKVIECVRKLQAAAAKALREKPDEVDGTNVVAPLRLPKHLQDSARADPEVSSTTQLPVKPNGDAKPTAVASETYKKVLFQEQEPVHEEEEDYEHDYDNEDYEGYYNEDEDESGAYFTCDGEVVVQEGDNLVNCSTAHVQVVFDQEIYSPKIMITDSSTGEILTDMLIHTETEFQRDGDSCTWSGQDYTTNDPVEKTVTFSFPDSDSAMLFYDSCETSKAATYSSTDPES